MVVNMITPRKRRYWTSICKNGIEIASLMLRKPDKDFIPEIRLLQYAPYSYDYPKDDAFYFKGFYYVGAKDISYYDIDINVDPNKYDEILTRIKNLIIFS